MDPSEIEGLIPTITTQGQLNFHEAWNIGLALVWSESARPKFDRPNFVRTLKSVHRRMFDRVWRWAGTFRRTQKNIGVEAFRIESELIRLFDDVQFWIENQTEPAETLTARFHHRLVWIHPFPNGNGRWARLVTEMFAKRVGWPKPKWTSVDQPINVSRNSYLSALRAADQGDSVQLSELMFPVTRD